MKLFLEMANFIVPFVIFGIVTYGVLMHVNVYDTFIKGARNGFFTVIKIMPTLIGLMIAVGILRASGFLDFLSELVGRFSGLIGFPGELVPLTVVKMFSSSAATGLLLDIFKEFIDIRYDPEQHNQKSRKTYEKCLFFSSAVLQDLGKN